MRTVSDRFLANLPRVNHWKTIMEWSNDGFRTFKTSPVLGGSSTASHDSSIHWQARDLRILLGEGINSLTTQFRIKQGIVWNPGNVEYLTLGLYRCTRVRRSLTRLGREVYTVNGDSFESYVIDGPVTSPRTLPAATAEMTLRALMGLVFKSPGVGWGAGVDRFTRLPEMLVERDIWPLIMGSPRDTSVGRALGALIFPDGDGAWQVVPTPSLEDELSFQDQAVITAEEELELDGVRNISVVTGTGTTLVGPVSVADNNPASPTYVGRAIEDGGVGRRPDFYESELILNQAQALRVAAARLAQNMGTRQTVSFTGHYDPTKEPGDVGVVGGVRVILDSVDYDFSPTPGAMTGSCRTTATRYAGDNYELPEEGSE